LSIIAVLQGKPNVAAVPQVVGKISAAVSATPVTVALDGVYFVSNDVPKVFGKFCCAHAVNAGSSNV
jgi:hypothetical protein